MKNVTTQDAIRDLIEKFNADMNATIEAEVDARLNARLEALRGELARGLLGKLGYAGKAVPLNGANGHLPTLVKQTNLPHRRRMNKQSRRMKKQTHPSPERKKSIVELRTKALAALKHFPRGAKLDELAIRLGVPADDLSWPLKSLVIRGEVNHNRRHGPGGRWSLPPAKKK